ncbi:bifunctional transcriptional activator/DNA repair enzyme AdaA [Desulfitobacterium hafniense]|uniref:HTH araC/xylS-type domain-containing protein n=5 Tax=root TaxID=1 RepID=Q24YT5_DESHY|nr:Ada metal-binding domain-containing protein [Desulfitobacterium hafniense]ACL20138.1 transcriptional regulator, AraC family [Desulfitobacterium hafniense DCB-2]EHL05933.1 transcriptional regulator, AraC family [Desulfitobacterium hafniense DP7]KTE90378.1 AraC family transcriptional regulator [Desulfitobacterium hafniense]MEA5021518.1 Ada metal-binding domain-containing protein [Desulfitobacterium hafniense]CDX00944.1 Transcriptional regulator, AraC [Desulfitobacterium hafniense]
MTLSTEEKWQAVLACDPAYDGQFFYGVQTTGIFCRPSCKSKNPKRENVVFFDNAAQARAWGLRPCKRCRPDLAEFQPQKELAEKIKGIYDLYFADHSRLREELKKLGVGRNRTGQVFYAHYGKIPAEYLNTLRIESAQKLLTHTQESTLQIALQSGFESLSTFYTHFRRLTGVSPKEYRCSALGKEEAGEGRCGLPKGTHNCSSLNDVRKAAGPKQI